MIHFVFGPTGAGKSTYAHQLALDRNAVRFSVDEWMSALFFPDIQGELTFEWAMARVHRCETQIWHITRQLLAQGKEVVLEISMSTKQLREKQIKLAETTRFPYLLHYIDADIDLRRARVRHRNKQKGATYAFDVNDDMFDFVEKMFEAPTAQELEGAEVVKN